MVRGVERERKEETEKGLCEMRSGCGRVDENGW